MENEVLIGGVEKREIGIVDYDPSWPDKFARHAGLIAEALGETALAIEHVGSTSVHGLGAKPIVDIITTVPDASDEDSYLPALMKAGYVLRVREPLWHEHRMFRTPARDAHIHIFSTGCPEIRRQLAFRDWLRVNEADRMRYEAVKRKLAAGDWPDMNAYASEKSEIVEEVTAKALEQANDMIPQRAADAFSGGSSVV
jgi:GrpB-like predicted nucleotidyltransferase (UPF0157 family)